MSRRKEPAIPNELLDQLLAGDDAGTALALGRLLDALEKALTERALNAEMDHHLAGDDAAGNTRKGYGTVRNFVREAGYRQMTKRSPKMTANWLLASPIRAVVVSIRPPRD